MLLNILAIPSDKHLIQVKSKCSLYQTLTVCHETVASLALNYISIFVSLYHDVQGYQSNVAHYQLIILTNVRAK